MIRQNIIQNFLVMVEDIGIMENIFGTDLSTLKGRTTRQRQKLVVDYFIEIPRELIEKKSEVDSVHGYYVHQSTGVVCNN